MEGARPRPHGRQGWSQVHPRRQGGGGDRTDDSGSWFLCPRPGRPGRWTPSAPLALPRPDSGRPRASLPQPCLENTFYLREACCLPGLHEPGSRVWCREPGAHVLCDQGRGPAGAQPRPGPFSESQSWWRLEIPDD